MKAIKPFAIALLAITMEILDVHAIIDVYPLGISIGLKGSGEQGSDMQSEIVADFENLAQGASPSNFLGWAYYYGYGTGDGSYVAAYSDYGDIRPPCLPDRFNDSGDNFLKLSTELGTLVRNFSNASSVTIPSSGLFLDANVQFTLTDPADRPYPSYDDEILIWLENDYGSSDGSLCIYGGCYDRNGRFAGSKVYRLSCFEDGGDATIVRGTWHRLTVKALRSAIEGTTQYPCFQIFLDGQLMKTEAVFAADVNDWESLHDGILPQAVLDIFDTGTYIPACTAEMPSLSSASFFGEGALDNIVLTGTSPAFATANQPTANQSTFTIIDGVLTSVELNGAKEFAIPDGVTAIKENAFSNCVDLIAITIPASVKRIDKNVFSKCKNLREVHISDIAAWCGISFGNYAANPIHFAKNLYFNDEPLIDLIIPEGVTSIADHAFRSCTGLVNVAIASSVSSIGEYAFYYCPSPLLSHRVSGHHAPKTPHIIA